MNHILKYILIGLITMLAIKYIPTTTLLQTDILMISFIVAISYALLDIILPSYTKPSYSTPSPSPTSTSINLDV